MTDFYNFHDQLWWWKKFRVVVYLLIHSRSTKKETGNTDIITSVHTVLSIFPVSRSHFAYFSSSFTPVSEKRWSRPVDWQASKSCVTARRSCCPNLHWCQAGRQGLIRIFENVVRIPNDDDRFLQQLMLSWPTFKEWRVKGEPRE